MRPFTQSELQWLLSQQEAPCVSIFLPVHRHHPESAQDPIRYKKLLSRAEDLLSKELSAGDLDELMKPLRSIADGDFWRHQEDGLAVMRSRSAFVHYRLPVQVPELSVVAVGFHTKPLVAYLHSNRKFFLLALSRNHVALHQGTPHSMVPVNLAGLPGNLREALGVEEKIGHLGTHSGPGKSAVFHGQGAAEADRKDEVGRYFRQIDRALWTFLREERAPLLLAGVKEYHPIYHEVSRYPYLLDDGVEGNVDREKSADLHARAWPIVAKHFEGEEDQALANYAQLVSQKRASDDLGEIAAAVAQGRVRQLLLQKGKQVWGRFHEDSGQVDVQDTQVDAHDADVLDELAEAVLRRDGQVLVLPVDRMPTRAPAAATYRY